MTPDKRDCLNKIKRDGASSWAPVSNREHEIPSGPAAELEEISHIESMMMYSVIVISVWINSSSWCAIDSTEKKTSGSITCLFRRGVVRHY